MEFSTKGTRLEVKAHSESKYKTAYGLYNTPDMGGNKEKIDVTNLSDSHKRSIDGIADYGSLQFDFYDTKNVTDSEAEIKATYTAFRAWDIAGTLVDFRLVYPDGTGFEWSGTVSVSRDAAAVNNAMKFKVYSSLESELKDYTEPKTTSYSLSANED
ncbi:MAG: phage tail protein [Oscillospiraceae bacterium]|nr:phage tail protein [Oscillospiraceae bacterium]